MRMIKSKSQENESMREPGFDFVKAVACVAVVLIHYNFKGEFGAEVKAACRFAVPTFLMISGYFLHPYGGGDVRTDKIMRQILKLTKLLLLSTFAYGLLFWFITPNAVYFGKYLSAAALAKFAVTNDGLFNSALWFLGGLVYCYFLVAMCCRSERALQRFLYLAIPALMMMCVTQEFARIVGFRWNYLQLSGAEPKAVICLSALFMFRALPFFLIGSYLRRKTVEIKRLSVSGWSLLAIAVMGSALAVAEYHLLGNRIAQFYLGSYVTATALLLWAVRKDRCASRGAQILSWVGMELSMLVYLTHVGVGKLVDVSAGTFHWCGKPLYDCLRWLLVLAGSFLVSFLLNRLMRMARR